MRLILFALFVATSAAIRNSELDAAWATFKATYNKTYDPQEEPVRRLVWEENMAIVEKHNLEAAQGKHTFTLNENMFSDMTKEEFRKKLNGFKHELTTRNEAKFTPDVIKDLPAHFDWRSNGCVTGVKNQGICGSCWAFSAVGSIECQHKLANGQLLDLNVWQIVECDTSDSGCSGGTIEGAFLYVIRAGGLVGDFDGNCTMDPRKVVATISSYKNVQQGSETDLQQAVATIGTVSVAIDASRYSFQAYAGGVYDDPDCSSTELDHAVLVVGYGTDDGLDYWIVKNSWGTSWGEQGYIRMSRNKNNQCGIATDASYPIV